MDRRISSYFLPWLLIAGACDQPAKPDSVEPNLSPEPVRTRPEHEPERVTVQQILVSFQGNSSIAAERSRDEAETLAEELLRRARTGEDFTSLVEQYSDQPPHPYGEPGLFRILNHGVEENAEDALLRKEVQNIYQENITEIMKLTRSGRVSGEERDQLLEDAQAQFQDSLAQIPSVMPRGTMLPGFADMSFSLSIGEVGLVPFEAKRAPFGWHVVKRLE